MKLMQLKRKTRVKEKMMEDAEEWIEDEDKASTSGPGAPETNLSLPVVKGGLRDY